MNGVGEKKTAPKASEVTQPSSPSCRDMLLAAQTGLPAGGLPPSSSSPALLVTMVTLTSMVTSADGFLEGAWLVTVMCAF